MYADLISRTLGFCGVFISLIILGLLDTPKFIITPQQSFSALELNVSTINTASAASAKSIEKEQALESEEAQEETTTKNNEATPEQIKEEVETTPPSESERLVKPIDVEPVNEVVKPQEMAKVQPVNKPKVQEQPKPKPQNIHKDKTKDNPKVIKDEKPKPQNKAVKEEQVVKETKAKPKSSEQTVVKQPQNTEQANSASSQQAKAHISLLLIQEIKSKLRYPRNAVRRRLQGTVMVDFEINQGIVKSFSISKSSGHKILDEAARKLAASLMNFNTGMSSLSNHVIVPIKYELI